MIARTTSPTTDLLIGASLAPGTIRAYATHLRGFDVWLHQERRSYETPADRDAAIADYVACRFDRGSSPAYIRQAVTAIRWAARSRDEPDPVGRLGRAALRGAARKGRGRGLGQVKGLDHRAIERAATLAAADGTLKGIRDAAILRCGFDGLLRISEIGALRISDYERWPDGTGRLRIRSSKTDQEGTGATLFVGVPTVDALERWLRRSRLSEDHLFVKCHKLGHAVPNSGPLHNQTLRQIIQRRAAAAGVQGRVSGHSLRVGCAQSLARRGASLTDLMTAGRWTSADTAASYVRREFAGRGVVARLIYS